MPEEKHRCYLRLVSFNGEFRTLHLEHPTELGQALLHKMLEYFSITVQVPNNRLNKVEQVD